MIVFRDMTPADAPEAAALARASTPDHPWTEAAIHAELSHKQSRCRAAVIDGRLAAFLFIRAFPDENQVMEISVHPDFRRRGLARALLAEADAPLSLEVRAGNAPALRLYESLGFAVIGRRSRYYEGREDAVLMEKRT